MKVTARDVAALAGVSPATVSMVFRGHSGISEATRLKVYQAAESLNYQYRLQPHTKGKALIQFVIFKRHGHIISDTPFFEDMIQGVTDYALNQGFQTSVFYFYGTENSEEQIRSLKSIRCAGIVVLATEMRKADLQVFNSFTVPVVLLDSWFPGNLYDAVVVDNLSGAIDAIVYLQRCGHSRIGYLKSTVRTRNYNERWEGYWRSIKMQGQKKAECERWVINVGPTTDTAFQSMESYLRKDPLLPTAFLADNDSIAIGAMSALQKAGYRIPEEISVVGFDGTSIGAMTEPALTSMLVPARKLGALAVKQLLDRMQSNQEQESVRICLQPKLLVRNSVMARAIVSK